VRANPAVRADAGTARLLAEVKHVRSLTNSVPPTANYSVIYQKLWSRKEFPNGFLVEQVVQVPPLDGSDTPPTPFQLVYLNNVPLYGHVVVRKDYEWLENAVADDFVDPVLGGVVVVGQPGQGKTLFLYFYLCKLLLSATPVVFQTKADVATVFTESGVYSMQLVRKWYPLGPGIVVPRLSKPRASPRRLQRRIVHE